MSLISALFGTRNRYWKRIRQDGEAALWLLRKGRFRKCRNYLWARFVVRDIGGGFRDFFYRTFPRLAPFPKEVEVEITTRCHLRCIICENTHWQDANYRKQDLNFESFVKLCEQFPDLRFINVTGEGTCWMNKDFMKMLRYLDERDAYTLVVESFDLFDEEKIKQVIPLDVARVECSLDAATAATYEKIKVGAKWDRTLANLRKLREYKVKHRTPFPLIYFRYVITTLNLQEMPAFVDLIGELDMNPGQATDLQFAGLLAFDAIKYLDVPSIPLEIVQEVEARAKKWGNLWIEWSHTKNAICPMEQCTKWLQPYIMIGGDVVLDCAVLMSNNRPFLVQQRFGNVFADGMKNIWYSERYRKARESVNKVKGPVHIYCKDCRGVDTSRRQNQFGVFGDQV